ncbi:hypothetical protein ACTD5D_16995 [Nocardia takedensis]|uniref:hypothetical protein n=1 Tax=Nocardia takedensis TaxID=259390 RepID=UPI0002D7E2ED|nr:hypothetical protein [Nocardia takedensis]
MTADNGVVRGALVVEQTGPSPVVTMPVAADEPVFAGHFPHFPIFPAIGVIDFVRRAAVSTHPAPRTGLRVESVRRARFLNPIRPGDRLTARLTWERTGERWHCSAAVGTADGPAARLSLVFGDPPASPSDVVGARDSRHPVMTGSEIHRLLPHRYPMLLIDRVVGPVTDQEVFAQKAVTRGEPWYQSPPGGPEAASDDYPAALVLESWSQAAAVLIARERPSANPLDTVPLFGSLSGARLPAPVRPGDVMDHHVRIVRRISDTVLAEGVSTVDGRPVLEVEQMTIALRPIAAVTGNGRPRKEAADDRTRA